MCLSRIPDQGAVYRENYDQFIGNTSDRSRMSHLGSGCILLALLIIGSIAAAAAYPPSAISWTAIGLGLGYGGVKLLGGSLQERKWDLIPSMGISLLITTLGILGVTGVVSEVALGYLMLGTALFAGWMNLGMMLYAQPKQCIKQKQEIEILTLSGS